MEQTPATRFVEILGRLGYKTQQQIADLLDIARPTAGTIVRGEREPSFSDVAKLKAEHDEVNIDWIFTGNGQALGRNLTRVPQQEEQEPADEVEAKPIVRRKMRRPIMTADPDLSHLTPEQQARYWKRRHDELLADQAQEYEAQVHQETLRLINFPNASSDTADLYAFADSLAVNYTYVSEESLAEVRSLAKFRPTPPSHSDVPGSRFPAQASLGSLS